MPLCAKYALRSVRFCNSVSIYQHNDTNIFSTLILSTIFEKSKREKFFDQQKFFMLLFLFIHKHKNKQWKAFPEK